ncbi:MAG: ABC transporter permease [Salinivirgaceae bacterium]|nr:ABC transporter permease [Salinivirgaceae bacterium]
MMKLIKYIKILTKEVWRLWINELKRVFSDGGVMLLFFGATIIYPLIYGLSYQPEVLQNIPVAIVDQDNSSSSRTIIQMLDATEQIHCSVNLGSLNDAKNAFFEGAVSGVILIPENFEKDILQEKQTPLVVYADASYLLVYKQTVQGVMAVVQQKNKDIKRQRYEDAGVPKVQAIQLSQPVRFNSEALYNPSSGYGSYTMVGLLILIIQQSLLMGIGMLSGSDKERGGASYISVLDSLKGSVSRLIVAKILAYLTIYIPVSMYMLYVIPHWFNLPHAASPGTILAFVIPFLISVSLLGLLLSALFRSREQSVIVLLFTSIPLIFLSGFSWPVEAFPWGFNYLAHLFPSTPAVIGFLKISVMGLSISEIRVEWYEFWIMSAIFMAINLFVLHRVYNRYKRKTAIS